MSQTTRRGLLGALGAAGLASLGSGSASAQLGGGPEADAMSEYRVPTYRVPESDLDSPGVVGRRVEITAGGATYDTGDQLVDLGDRWELVSPNYGSLSAEDPVNIAGTKIKPTDTDTRPNATVPRAEIAGHPASGMMVGERFDGPSVWRATKQYSANTDSSSWSYIGEPFTVPMIDAPAGAVPVVYAHFRLSSDTDGEPVRARLDWGNVGEIIRVETHGGTDWEYFYEERYLTEYDGGTAKIGAARVNGPNCSIRLNTPNGTNSGNINATLDTRSRVGIKYEVV